jgi:Lar family restriction alleviation protein
MSRSEEVELKPCPFCGGEGWIVVDAANTYQPPLWRPQCKACGGGLGGLDSKAEAIAAWNTRAPSALPVGWKLVPVEPTWEMCKAGAPCTGADHGPCDPNECAEDTYRAMLSASPPEPVSGWRDIATAPRDSTGPRTPILIQFGAEGMAVGFWDDYYADGGRGCTDGFPWIEPFTGDPLNLHFSDPPTHWMPLPNPPSEPGVK